MNIIKNKILKIGYSLYASKKYKGNEILEYTKKAELKSKNKCLLDNSSWFGNIEIAKSYKKKKYSYLQMESKKNNKSFYN